MSRGDFKRAFLAGQYADLVADALAQRAERETLATVRAEKGASAATTLQAPPGYRVTVTDTEILLDGPFDQDLHQRIKRAGGGWDGMTGTNRKCWVLPLAKGVSLKRILANWAAPSVPSASDRERTEAERWLGYVEDKVPTYVYQRGVNTLRDLRIERWPDLQERLDAALAACAQAAAARAAAAERERAARVQERAAERAARGEHKHRRILYPLSALPILQVPVALGQALVVFERIGKSFRIAEDDPSVHGSHLLGHEGEPGSYAYYRDATAEETAAYRERAVKADDKRLALAHAREELARLVTWVQRHGTRPAEFQTLSGERLLDTQTAYGGGAWWVIEPERIWYCENNGADGDDWGRNNVRTGGAGAIGWWIPANPSVVDDVRRLAAIVGGNHDECDN